MAAVFGVSMTTIATVLVAGLALCLLSVAWVAWRRPVIFKLGVRNIPRRTAQTTLIVVGLMLSTLIIAASLGTGDTLEHSLSADVYNNLGHVDELVVASQEVDAPNADTSAKIDAGALALVEGELAGNPVVDGVMPVLEERVPALNQATNLAEPDLVLAGLDPARIDRFGGLQGEAGAPIDLAALPADGIILSAKTAGKLEAKVGDALVIFYNNAPTNWTVAGIAGDSYLSGVRRDRGSGLEVAGMVMPLAALQTLTGQEDTLSAIAISNRGGVRDGVAETDAVRSALRGALTGKQLGVDAIKREAVDNGEEISAQFAKLFLVLGLFAIATGVLLILLIFTMLAAERRYEMGMTRAVGAQRSQLVQQFVAEGAGYAVLSGLVGAALGVGAAVGIARGMSWLFGQYVPIQAHVEPRSLVVAYCLGVVITFGAVVASSWRISRLNVVAAVRDLPDLSSPKRKRGVLVWSGLLLLAGGLLMVAGQGAGEAVPLYLGLSFLPFGVGLLVRYFGAPGRPVLTLVGFAILGLWLLPHRVAEAIFGDLHRGVELFFLSGILMVVAATMVIVQNCDVLLVAVSRLGGLFRSKLPAVRVAIAYPGATRGRTGMTIAMFSLIVFSLVMIATVSKNVDGLLLGDDANAGWDVRVDAMSANPLADFRGTLHAKGVDTSPFTAIGVTTLPNPYASQLRLSGTDAWKSWSVVGMDEGYIRDSKLKFQDRATGYTTDADVIEALATRPDVAVIDSFALPGSDDRGNDAAFKLDGFTRVNDTFTPITVELADPDGGAPHPVTIIGVIDSELPTLFGLFANQRTIGAIYPEAVLTSYSIALADPSQADTVAKEIEAALLQNGVQATSIRDELRETQRQATGFLYLIEGFMGLGLLVGMAAVGVVAFRAVVERRQQIGVLRAIGYQRGTVALSFLIETAFVVGLGVLSGTVLGLILARNLFTSDAIEASTAGAGFMVPVPLISTILVVTMVVALLMTWLPARQASRIAPAEALRYE